MSQAARPTTAWGERLLAERAARLAERPRQDAHGERRRVCLCEAGEGLYGLPVEAITRVAPYKTPAPLADAPPELLGIISRGGGFALVYDLCALVAAARTPSAESGHLIFLRQQRPLIALRVARSLEVADVELLAVDDAINLPIQTGVSAYGRACDQRIVSIIDTAALISARTQHVSGG